jgi:hypothetical protein
VRKFILPFCAVVSILLLATVSVFWVWSRSHSGYVRLHQGPHFVAFYPSPVQGLTITSWLDTAPQKHALNSVGSWPMTAGSYAYQVNRAGLQWQHVGIEWSELKHLDHGRSLIIPNGILAGAFTMLPLFWMLSINAHQKRKPQGAALSPAA